MSVFSSPSSAAWSPPVRLRQSAPPVRSLSSHLMGSFIIPATAEGRRLRALELKRDGWQQSEIAIALDVTPGAVSQWMRRAREQGADGLKSRRDQSGARPRLSPEQWEQIAQMMAQGPQAHGLGETDEEGNVYWSVKDIACLIERTFGVHYHPSHVGRVLKQRGIARL